MLCDIYTISSGIFTQDIVHVKLDYGARVGVMQGVKSNPAHKWFCIDKVGHNIHNCRYASRYKYIYRTVDMSEDTDYRYIYFQMRPDQAWLFCQYDSRTRVSSSI